MDIKRDELEERVKWEERENREEREKWGESVVRRNSIKCAWRCFQSASLTTQLLPQQQILIKGRLPLDLSLSVCVSPCVCLVLCVRQSGVKVMMSGISWVSKAECLFFWQPLSVCHSFRHSGCLCYICWSVYLSVLLSMCLSVCLSAYVSFCLSMCLLVFLHLYPTLYHCVDLFVSLFVCVPVCLSVCIGPCFLR